MAEAAGADAVRFATMKTPVLCQPAPPLWAVLVSPDSSSRGLVDPECWYPSRLLHKGVRKLWNLTGGRPIAIHRSDEVRVLLVGPSSAALSWVVPSQIDAPDLWVVCATASRGSESRITLPPGACSSSGPGACLGPIRRLLVKQTRGRTALAAVHRPSPACGASVCALPGHPPGEPAERRWHERRVPPVLARRGHWSSARASCARGSSSWCGLGEERGFGAVHRGGLDAVAAMLFGDV